MDFINMFTEKLYLENMKQQLKADDTMNIMGELKILIVSDTAWGRALGLLAYISEKTNVQHVELATNYCEAKKYVEGLNGIDILIYVGNQEESDNYRIINLVKRYKNNVLICMYAYLDYFTNQKCNKYNIFFTFHCEEPVCQFLISLQSFYKTSQKIITITESPNGYKTKKVVRKLWISNDRSHSKNIS